MAKIRREPVSSAFYASDFPPIFAPDSSHLQIRSELNDSSDTTLYGGDPVLAGAKSNVSLLDFDNRTISLEVGLKLRM